MRDLPVEVKWATALQASQWLEADMDTRFGPFSDCAREHVAVKPQKGEPVC